MNEEETPKNRFEGEMTRMMNLVIFKIEGLETKVSGLEKGITSLKGDVSGLKQEVSKNSQKLDVLSSQFNDVAVMAIKDNQRITKLEIVVTELQNTIH